MGWLSNKIKRDQLKPGDHIYTWRNAFYAHHGIYVGEGKVTHFALEDGKRKISGFIFSSSASHSSENRYMRIDDSLGCDGDVISSCLDCFLSGGYLYRYEYDVTRAFFITKVRGGTCTLAPSDPSEDVLHRASYLLDKNGFGSYNLLKKNCEDFALYCKTGLLVDSSTSKSDLGCSGQVTAMLSFGCRRLENDIGFRTDVSIVPVEELCEQAEIINVGG